MKQRAEANVYKQRLAISNGKDSSEKTQITALKGQLRRAVARKKKKKKKPKQMTPTLSFQAARRWDKLSGEYVVEKAR